MSKRELILEAKSVVDLAMTRINNRVLSKAAELKPRTVSIAQRAYELLGYISSILNGLAERVKDEDKSLVSLGSWFYIAFYKDRFTIVRSKPYTITLSYTKGEGRLTLSTRWFNVIISSTTLELRHLAMKVSIDVGSIEDITRYEAELKYLLRRMGRIVEFNLYPVAEKRI